MRGNRTNNGINQWSRAAGASLIGGLAVLVLAGGFTAATQAALHRASSGTHGPAPEGSDSGRDHDLELLEIDMFYQFSETDNDAEVTIDVEADEPVDHLRIIAPDNHTVATVRSKDHLGLAEIELESAEPSVDEVQAAYPEGTYWFVGRAVTGARLLGQLDLVHEVVDAPDFFNFPP